MGVQLGFMGVQLGGKVIWAGLPGLRLRCGDWRAAAGGCHCASPDDEASCCGCRGPALRAARSRLTALVVSAGHMPGPAGRPVLPPLFACEMRARPALAVLAWSGDGSPVWGCTTTSGDQVPSDT